MFVVLLPGVQAKEKCLGHAMAAHTQPGGMQYVCKLVVVQLV